MDSSGDRPMPAGAIPIQPYPSATSDALVRASPPRNPTRTAEHLRSELARLDGILIAVVVVFAFFMGSYTAINSDVWMHLASGRLIAEGSYSFGVDPFSFTTDGVRWVNHAWLPDWLAYLISSAFGGPEDAFGGGILVLLKALTIVALTAVMFLICRRSGGMWPAAVLVTLGLLAMSPRLLLQPRCMSFLFLAITLYLLTRASARSRLVAIPLLLALWVNVDEWFILGPLTVALFWLGRIIQGATADVETAPDARNLAITFVLGLAACLLNPYHVFAFQLPSELWAWVHADAVEADPFAAPLVRSAWRFDNVYREGIGVLPAGLAFYALLLLGFGSFVAVRDRWPWWRGLVWGVFAILGLTLERTIPFFAVAGTVVAILNWQDFFATRTGAFGSITAMLGRLATIVAALGLAIFAWPGWLTNDSMNQNLGHYPRRVSWAIYVDPSLKGASEKLAQLRAVGVIRESAHGLNFTREMANYWAWFCPREQGFIDLRFALFRSVAVAYVDLKQALKDRPNGGATELIDWPAEFRARAIDHIVVGGIDREVNVLPLPFWFNPQTWTLLYADGRTCIFGWNDPKDTSTAERFQAHAVDFNARAFGPNIAPADRAPENAPPPPQSRSLWETFLIPGRAHPLATDQSKMYLAYFDTVARRQEQDVIRIVGGYGLYCDLRMIADNADTAIMAPLGIGIFKTAISPFWSHVIAPNLLAQLRGPNLAPPALLTLAVRAARRAAEQNPNGAATYDAIATAYLALWQQQEARWLRGQRGSLLQRLRMVQALTAMQNYQTLRPDDFNIHRTLAIAYRQMDLATFLPGAPAQVPLADLEIWHWREALRLQEAAASARARVPEAEGGRTDEEVRAALNELERQINEREQYYRLDERRNRYEIAAAPTKHSWERALHALQEGLVKEAMDVYGRDTSAMPPPVVHELFRRLHLVIGRSMIDLQGGEPFHDPWDNVQAAAASGDYHNADLYLQQLLRATEANAFKELMGSVRDQTIAPRSAPSLGQRIHGAIQGAFQSLDALSQLEVIRGVLALEVGDTHQAVRSFERSLQFGQTPSSRATLMTPFAAGSVFEIATYWSAVARQPPPAALVLSTQPVAQRYLQLLKREGVGKRIGSGE